MTALTFRNSFGDLIDIPAVPATQFKNALAAVMERTQRGGAVAITKHDTPKAVLLSYDEFVALTRPRGDSLDDLGGEFDGLLARLQTPAARRGLAAAFDATPAQIGAAAVKAARAGVRIGATGPATKGPLSRGRRAVRTPPKRAQTKR